MIKGVEKGNVADRKTLTGRVTSLPDLLTRCIEQDVDSVKYSTRRAALLVWIGTVPSCLNLDKYCKEESYLPATGQLTSKGASDYCNRNGFQVEEDG